jgi:CRISPR-associated protein Csb1
LRWEESLRRPSANNVATYGWKGLSADLPRGQYATEGERKNAQGEVEAAESVLLDSVQSQANRMELALLNAINSGRLRLPIIRVKVEFSEGDEKYAYPNINSYTVPHRVSDAIIRDSVVIDGKEIGKHFWESTDGKEITEASIHNARAFFKYCPTALLFGTWDSHSFVKRGLKSAKVARALCSEVIGLEAKPGKRTASRVDPLHLSGFTLKKSGDGNYGWEIVERKPDKKAKETKGMIGHGNVTPYFKSETGERYAGGFDIREARQTALLSFAQLRRLSFAQGIDELITTCPNDNAKRAKFLSELKAMAASKDDKEKASFPQEEFCGTRIHQYCRTYGYCGTWLGGHHPSPGITRRFQSPFPLRSSAKERVCL